MLCPRAPVAKDIVEEIAGLRAIPKVIMSVDDRQLGLDHRLLAADQPLLVWVGIGQGAGGLLGRAVIGLLTDVSLWRLEFRAGGAQPTRLRSSR
jgi:hypothetical protein